MKSNQPIPNPGRRHSNNGAALMMTLIMLVLLSILITGFVVSMRTELKASYSAEHIQRTKMVSQAAVSHGIELLRSNIPDPSGIAETVGTQSTQTTARNWASAPGRLFIDTSSAPGPLGDAAIVDLHTGVAPSGGGGGGSADISSFDLNAPLAGESAGAIVNLEDGVRPTMRVSWVNILKDPTQEAGTPLEDGKPNAIIGRYAFWMDDETSKLNFNTALRKNENTYQWLEDEWLVPYTSFQRGWGQGARQGTTQVYVLGHPATVNLDVLFKDVAGGGSGATDGPLDITGLYTHIFAHGFHQYPESFMEYYDFDDDPENINEEEKQWYDENKWNLTFYNRSPEFNVFGKSRFFTTLDPLALEGGPAYQMPFAHNNVLHLHNLFGGLEHGADDGVANRANAEVLVDYFHRTDWPGYEGLSFASKWADSTNPEDMRKSAFQVAINIIQMAVMASGDLREHNANVHRYAMRAGQEITDAGRNDVNAAEGESNRWYIRGWPRRDLWRSDEDEYKDLEDLFLPQRPGPHLTEVKVQFDSERVPSGELPSRFKSGGEDYSDGANYYWITFQYETEYYMHPHGWAVPTIQGVEQVDNGDGTFSTSATDASGNPINGKLSPFPTMVDFVRIDAVPDISEVGGTSPWSIPLGQPWHRIRERGIPGRGFEGRLIQGRGRGVWVDFGKTYWHHPILARGHWYDPDHADLMIDPAPQAGGGSKWVMMPIVPRNQGRPPGVEPRTPHIRVAKSKKFYLYDRTWNRADTNPATGQPFGNWARNSNLTMYPTNGVNGSMPRADFLPKQARNNFVTEDEAMDFKNGVDGLNPDIDPRAIFPVLQVPQWSRRRGGGFTGGRLPIGNVIDVDFKFRLGMAAPNTDSIATREDRGDLDDLTLNDASGFIRPKQLVPYGLDRPRNNDALDEHVFTKTFQIDLINSPTPPAFGWEIQRDPRVAREKEDWVETSFDSLDARNSGIPAATDPRLSKFRHLQFGSNKAGQIRVRGVSLRGRRYVNRGSRSYNTTYRFASPGYYSLIHTGQHAKVDWRTLSLMPRAQQEFYPTSAAALPDYLLLDLFAPSFPMDDRQWRSDNANLLGLSERRLPDSFSIISFMNSTAGQVNLNCKVYPEDTNFDAPDRTKPLEAVFTHLRDDDDFAEDFADEILAYQEQNGPFGYVGELAEVPGYLPPGNVSAFRKEELLRNMCGTLTTNSNTFGMYGVAQTVRKSPGNLESDPSAFQEGDDVLGEKRFFALIERYIWPGRDGAPGNASVGEDGRWDKLAQPPRGNAEADLFVNTQLHDIPGAPPRMAGGGANQKFFAPMDGPDPVDMLSPYDKPGEELKQALADVVYDSNNSTLESAYNPPHPVVKYRVVYFKYLDQ